MDVNESQMQLPIEELKMTLEDFAKWILELPDETKKKQIWFIDITAPYRGKPLEMDESPSGTHVSIEDSLGDEP
jgi:hypothetical protein